MVLNPAIGLTYQILSGIVTDSTLLAYSPILVFPSLIGGVLAGYTMYYLYEPLLLTIRFKEELDDEEEGSK